MIADLFLFSEALRRNRDEREWRMRPLVPEREPEFFRRLELPLCPIRHDAQIHVAVRPRLAAGVRAEEIDGAQGHHTVHRFETARERFALVLQRGREVFQEQFHDGGR